MSARNNPFGELERLFEQWNRQIEDADWLDIDAVRPRWRDEFAVDVLDETDHLVVTVDVPGYDRDDLDVHITDRTLLVAADHHEETEETEASYVRRERRHRSHRRQIELPADVDASGVTAKLHHGVLTITIPKAEPAADAHSIEIETD